MECKQNEESPGPDSICHTMMLVVVHVVYENYRKSSDSMESTIVGIHIIKTCVTPPYILFRGVTHVVYVACNYPLSSYSW